MTRKTAQEQSITRLFEELALVRGECDLLRAELAASQQEAGRMRDVVENIEWLATVGNKSRTVPFDITDGDWYRIWKQARAALDATGTAVSPPVSNPRS